MTDIDKDLTELAARLSWPEPHPVDATVAGAITTPSPRRAVRVAPAAALAVLAVAVLVLAIPAARDRVEAFFGIGQVTIERGVLDGAGDSQSFGAEIDLAATTVRLPVALGVPDHGYRDDSGRLWIVYGATAERSPALITVFDGVVEAGLTKLVADPSIQAKPVDVAGTPAYWVTGSSHFILFEGADGRVLEDRGRRSSQALIWQHDGLTYRLESEVDVTVAIEIAESVP